MVCETEQGKLMSPKSCAPRSTYSRSTPALAMLAIFALG